MKINSFHKNTLTFFIVFWLLIGIIIVVMNLFWGNVLKNDIFNNSNSGVMGEVFNTLTNNYVDSLNSSILVENAVNGMIKSLDPHTVYFTPKKLEEFKITTEGEFGGLGMGIDVIDSLLTIVNVTPESPTEKANLMIGDQIIKIDSVYAKSLTIDDSKKLLRGNVNTQVDLLIKRKKKNGYEMLNVSLVRENIVLDSIPYHFVIDNKKNIGYIFIRSFNSHTEMELEKALIDLENKSVEKIILDLRGNPGGLLNQAIFVIDKFIDSGKRVFFTKGKDSYEEFFTSYDTNRDKYNMIVLINEETASSAEIVAGALQDWDQALILGETSFGKGTVQRLKTLSDGSGLKYTTAKYYINSGRCIHNEKHNNDLLKRDYLQADNLHKNKIKKEYYTSLGRKVYGGGGIIPDVKIKLDKYNEAQINILLDHLFFKFCLDYVINKNYDVKKNIIIDKNIFYSFFNYCKKNKVNISKKNFEKNKDWIINGLRANLLGIKFGDNFKYKELINDDDQIVKAVEILMEINTKEDMYKYAEKYNEE